MNCIKRKRTIFWARVNVESTDKDSAKTSEKPWTQFSHSVMWKKGNQDTQLNKVLFIKRSYRNALGSQLQKVSIQTCLETANLSCYIKEIHVCK